MVIGQTHVKENIKKKTPYHPQGDGQCERRMNRTIISMLKALQAKEKSSWHKQLSKLAYAYNCTVHKSTGYSPHFLMFGREARMPVDAVFTTGGEEPKMQKSYAKFVAEWMKAMSDAFTIAKQHADKSGERNKRYYDKKVRGKPIVVGDRVLLRNLGEKGGTGKLRNFWQETVYVVEGVDPEVPVYTIRSEDGKGKSKRVHKNIIMKCNDILPLQTEETQQQQQQQKQQQQQQQQQPPVRRKRGTRGRNRAKTPAADNVLPLPESDSDDDIVIVRHEENLDTEEEHDVGTEPSDEHDVGIEPSNELDAGSGTVTESDAEDAQIDDTSELEANGGMVTESEAEDAQSDDRSEPPEPSGGDAAEPQPQDDEVNSDADADATIPYEEEAALEHTSDSTNSSDSERDPGERYRSLRPQRVKKPPARMTFDQVGGAPVFRR